MELVPIFFTVGLAALAVGVVFWLVIAAVIDCVNTRRLCRNLEREAYARYLKRRLNDSRETEADNGGK